MVANEAAIAVVPFDSARRGARMGAGPHALLQKGLLRRLSEQQTPATAVEVHPEDGFLAEVGTAFDLHRAVRKHVLSALMDGRLPLTLSGNCNTGVIGSLSAHDAEDVGLFWFDAHSDAETPETSTSGFLDGMGFAITLGQCWLPKLAELGWLGLSGERAVLIGAREVSPPARELLTRNRVAIVPPDVARTTASADALGVAVAQLRTAGVNRVHVHVDLDVLDPDLVGPANSYALPNGLSPEQLLSHLRFILEHFDLASASMASYDPSLDSRGTVAAAGLDAIALLARSGARPLGPSKPRGGDGAGD